ncbi:MAG: cation transporter, partial [Candidatus Methylomirabilales bacterium]
MVKRALEGLDGVQKAEVSFSKAQAIVTYDPTRVTLDGMVTAVEKAGFHAIPVQG